MAQSKKTRKAPRVVPVKKHTRKNGEVVPAHKRSKPDGIKSNNHLNLWRGWKLGNLAPYYEPIAFFMKPYDKYPTLTDNVVYNQVGAFNMDIARKDGKEIGNIINIDSTLEEKKNKLHEAQKPIDLIKFLIELSSIENQIVLDPFMGSGTTAKAAQELNRNFLGFEINEKYHKIANDRLK